MEKVNALISRLEGMDLDDDTRGLIGESSKEAQEYDEAMVLVADLEELAQDPRAFIESMGWNVQELFKDKLTQGQTETAAEPIADATVEAAEDIVKGEDPNDKVVAELTAERDQLKTEAKAAELKEIGREVMEAANQKGIADIIEGAELVVAEAVKDLRDDGLDPDVGSLVGLMGDTFKQAINARQAVQDGSSETKEKPKNLADSLIKGDGEVELF